MADKRIIHGDEIKRPSKNIIEKFKDISSASVAGKLSHGFGIKDPFIQGPRTFTPGKRVVGPALTLQFMPKREDVYPEGEYVEPEKQLHRHALYHTKPGDIIVVDARGSMKSGVFGNMMLTYFYGAGGLGAIIDGCIRDFGESKDIGLGLWLKGVTPNYHTQTEIFPFAVNVPIACGDTFVAPGDLIVADDDGAAVIPQQHIEEFSGSIGEYHEWEEFSRIQLEKGGDLRRYYPLSDEARPEYEAWKKKNSNKK